MKLCICDDKLNAFRSRRPFHSHPARTPFGIRQDTAEAGTPAPGSKPTRKTGGPALRHERYATPDLIIRPRAGEGLCHVIVLI
ncbi:hypothetical protein GQ53DRAFT_89217 [Thozetella sp. PMI_491]|nr:hypothetical protein GQ53DRAFT_89217 [Thozetella sp. PMI_491]